MAETTTETIASTPKPRKQLIKKPNYNIIHKDPLPLSITPTPELTLHNPLSVAYFLYSYFFAANNSHPVPLYTGIFNPLTSAVHITDERSVNDLWCRGFFGKGNLSRSEPTWLTRTKRRLGVIGADENLTSEEITERRRNERREFKAERAKAEREKLEKILAEEGKLTKEQQVLVAQLEEESKALSEAVDASVVPDSSTSVTQPEARTNIEVVNQEHLQLSLEEAFFLCFGLGSLQVLDPDTKKPLSPAQLLPLFRAHSYYPPLLQGVDPLQPDDPFLVSYAVYHHFRSLGWVVKSGIKFSVDYLLYNRGPVFSHAEFAIKILPAYEHLYYSTHPSGIARKQKAEKERTWAWLHAINRVCSQVKKTVILVYVVVPAPEELEGKTVGEMISLFRVKEISLRRWLPTRNRD